MDEVKKEYSVKYLKNGLKLLKNLLGLSKQPKKVTQMSSLKNPNVTAEDLDFSDISNQKQEELHYDPVPKKKAKPALTGIEIAIPLGGKYWVVRDLTDCTGEEFFAFVQMYYPAGLKDGTKASDFNNLNVRVSSWQKILDFHAKVTTWFTTKNLPVATNT